MNRFSLTLLVGLLVMLWGINGVSSMSTRAVVAGYDGSVVGNVYTPNRIALLGFLGSNLASELIDRGQETVILDKPSREDEGLDAQGPASTPVSP